MSIIRAQRAGDLLGSGVRVSPGTMRCPAVTEAPDPLKALVIRLEEAGATLLSLPSRGPSTRLAQARYEVVHNALDAYGWQSAQVRPVHPSAGAIDLMDEALRWLSLIPEERYVLRRIVGARALVHPITQRHLFPWRRLGTTLNIDHKTVQRWHNDGISLILRQLAV